MNQPNSDRRKILGPTEGAKGRFILEMNTKTLGEKEFLANMGIDFHNFLK